nr:hypothetical protein [Clostridioides difficile]
MSKLDEIEKAFLNNEFDIGFKIEKEIEFSRATRNLHLRTKSHASRI